MTQQTPLSMGRLAGVGFTLFGNVVVGLVLGVLAYKYAHWSWAVPAGVLLGFVSGFVSMMRQLAGQ